MSIKNRILALKGKPIFITWSSSGMSINEPVKEKEYNSVIIEVEDDCFITRSQEKGEIAYAIHVVSSIKIGI